MTSAASVRILLVSPSRAVVAGLRECLSATGRSYTIQTVASPGAALAALSASAPEIVIVDVGAGDDQRLRGLERISASAADTALIAITTSDDEQLAVRTLELGVQECLVGPEGDLEPRSFARVLRNALVRSAYDGSRPLAALIELSSDAILTINRDRLITRFNSTAERVYGCKAAEVMGKPALNLVPEPGHESQRQFLNRVLDGESVEAFEATRLMRDGRTVVMSMAGSPIVNAFGEVIEACVIIRDVTDQVSARLRLSEQSHLLESSQAAGHVGSWAIDRLTGRLDWSAEHYRLLKRDPSLPPATLDELIDLVHPDDRAIVQASFYRDASFTFEARFIADPDDVRIMRVVGEYFPREDGNPGRLLGITQDVTDERAEQAARRLAEEQLERSFEEALIGMMLIDMQGRWIRVNSALCEIFGRSREELLATTFRELTHPDDRGDDEPVWHLLLSGQQKHHVREKRYLHADGHTIWAEVGISLIFNADNTPSHLVGQIQDITERRAYLESLRHMADHDALTGLLNRRSFYRELGAHLARAQRYGATGALLMFDLDNFKLHNDKFGHPAGDDLLVALANRLRKRLRTTDVICRLGGDEFAVLLPDAGRKRACLVTQALLRHIDGITTEIGTGSHARVTASVGLVCFENLRELSSEAVVRRADQAMYEAKRVGRNCFVEWQALHEAVTPASD